MQYEIMNKVTGETTPVVGVIFGNEEVTVNTDTIGNVVFSNIGKLGDLQNEEYAIREVGTHIEADGQGIVEDVVVATE